MAVGKRSGLDILFLANAHSKKFSDLDQNKEVQITPGLQNSRLDLHLRRRYHNLQHRPPHQGHLEQRRESLVR